MMILCYDRRYQLNVPTLLATAGDVSHVLEVR